MNSDDGGSIPDAETLAAPSPNSAVRILISYAHDDPGHEERVRQFWTFLRSQGIDARLDVLAANTQQEWPQWMDEQLRAARFVLVVASPAYKERAEGHAPAGEGRGVKWEARQLRDLIYRQGEDGLAEVVSVVLPGGTPDDLPGWLIPASRTWFAVTGYTILGAEKLLRLLTGQYAELEPPLGSIPDLPPRALAELDSADPLPPPGPLRTEVLITASLTNGELVSDVSIAGTPISSRTSRPSAEITHVWEGLKAGPIAAADRQLRAGRALAAALFDPVGLHQVADLAHSLQPGSGIDIVLASADDAISLPLELLRLVTSEGADLGPLALLPAVTVSRRVLLPAARRTAAPLAGPLKILAAVAAPDETKTQNTPLDVEAEMQAVLDAVTPAVGDVHAQVKILEVASLQQILAALKLDDYHVLHLSAHGSLTGIELEDEDGQAIPATASELLGPLRESGKAVPLIVLSSCSGGAAGSEAMAVSLIRRGAECVLAMQAPVTDTYATALTAALYTELSASPGQPVTQAVARARRAAEERSGKDKTPEFAIPVLLTAAASTRNIGLLDVALPEQPLTRPSIKPAGTSVRELGLGQLIGRRPQLREATAVLRRTPALKQEHGAIAGVQLLGIGGIGKTALAGRIIARLRADGWLVAVHEGRWNPARLFSVVTESLDGQANLADAQRFLAHPEMAEEAKLDLIRQLLGQARLLLVLDDFEQNLTPGGTSFQDPTFEDVLTGLSDAANSGALLVTCRYPIPGEDRALIPVSLPPLSPAELRRLFLRLPELWDLAQEDKRLLAAIVGGHPRLIEFIDALLRGKKTELADVQTKLRALARQHDVKLTGRRSLQTAVDDALILGAADIFIEELLALLTPSQRAALDQLAICRAPMSVADLTVALTGQDPPRAPDVALVEADAETLLDLTLLTPGRELLAHPWTAHLITQRRTPENPERLHQQGVAVRLRRFQEQRAAYPDLVDLPRHLAFLHRYDDVLTIAEQGTRMLGGSLAAAAYLSELRPIIPVTERAWILLADLEFQSILTSGGLFAAKTLFESINDQVEVRAATDPTNTEWQRDLSVSQDKLGDLAQAVGDAQAAAGYFQASLAIAERLAATDPTNTEWQRDLSISQNKLGDLAQAVGDAQAAAGYFQASLAIRERLAATDPTNTAWQRDLSISQNKLGGLAQGVGDAQAAAGYFQASLAIRERLAATDPTNTTWQRDLSISQERLGDLAQAVGDVQAAAGYFQASLAIRERLAATDPTNTAWQRDLSISQNKLGDLAQAVGDAQAAAGYFQASLAIAERLAATDPTNTAWQRDLSVSQERLGGLAQAVGDAQAAAGYFQASLAIRERLAATDPTNTAWQRDLSVSQERLGDLAQAVGDAQAAAGYFQASLAIRERLAATDPTNTAWQRDLSISQERLGDLAQAVGDAQAAAGYFQASLAIAERLAATDPTNTEWQRDLSVSQNKLGGMAQAVGDAQAAAGYFQASLAIAERLAATDPTNTEWQRDLSVSQNKLGGLAQAVGDAQAAAGYFQASLAIAERLAATDPTNTEWQRDLSVSQNKLGDLAQAVGDAQAAAGYFQASLAIAERLAATDPTNTTWQRDLSVSQDRLGDLAQAVGDVQAAAGYFQASLAIRERLAATDPTNTEWQRDLSISQDKLGDLAQAVGDAQAAAGYFQASLAIRERLAATDPTNTTWQRDLTVSQDRLGDLAQGVGDVQAAAGYFQASLAIRERLAATDPTNTAWQRDLTVSQDRLGDLAQGVGDVQAAAGYFQASLAIAERLAATDPTNTAWQSDLEVARQRLADMYPSTSVDVAALEQRATSATPDTGSTDG